MGAVMTMTINNDLLYFCELHPHHRNMLRYNPLTGEWEHEGVGWRTDCKPNAKGGKMSRPEHAAKTLLKIKNGIIFSEIGIPVCQLFHTLEGKNQVFPYLIENANRLVDCWNALEGIENPEAIPELLKAAKTTTEYLYKNDHSNEGNDICDNLQAAINKAKGK